MRSTIDGSSRRREWLAPDEVGNRDGEEGKLERKELLRNIFADRFD